MTDKVDECAQAILNEWRQIEPASAHVLAHMAARVAAKRFGVAVSDSQETQG